MSVNGAIGRNKRRCSGHVPAPTCPCAATVAAWSRLSFGQLGGLTHVFGGLESPLGCAISPASGLVFVVDSDHHRVCVFDPKGFVFAEGAAQRAAATRMRPPSTCVHAFLYSFGGVEGEWGAAGSGPGELRDPFDVALHEGCAYVTDASNDRISVFREDGTFVRCLPSSCERRGFKGRHRLLKAPLDSTLRPMAG